MHVGGGSAGFLVRPAIITPEQCAEIRDQVIRINKDPESLPPEHRNVPGGPASLLIDHPAVLGVLEELIGKDVRLESPGCVVREKGQRHGELHGGGPRQIDPIFGYRTQNGRIHAGMVRVIFEFSEIRRGDGGTHFLAGSHKAAFPMDESHMSLEPGKQSPFLVSYDCPPVRQQPSANSCRSSLGLRSATQLVTHAVVAPCSRITHRGALCSSPRTSAMRALFGSATTRV